MKCRVISGFVYKGKDKLPGDVVEIDDRDVVSFARRGLVEKYKEKKPAAGSSKKDADK